MENRAPEGPNSSRRHQSTTQDQAAAPGSSSRASGGTGSSSRNNVLPTTSASGISDMDISMIMANPEFYDLLVPDGPGFPSISVPNPMANLTYNPQEGFSLDRLKSELVRLTTFYTSRQTWPKPFIKPEDCAKAGFYYLGDGDKVQCAFCHGVVGEWEQGDNPMAEHRQHFPRCPFAAGLPVDNEPIGEDELAAATGGGYDICGPFVPLAPLPTIVRPYAGADGGGSPAAGAAAEHRGAQPILGDMDDITTNLAIKTGCGPVKKELVIKESRLETFTGWPLTCGQSAEAMAEAGFYYIGIEDHVKCFYCDGGLKNWESEDDPWTEHAKWFSECPFVKLNKGVDFIKGVLAAAGPRIPSSASAANCLKLHLARTAGSRGRKFIVTDNDVRAMVDTPLVQDVLRMGLNIGNVKAAIRHQLEHNGQPFINIETMLEAVLYEEEKDSEEYYSDMESDSDEDEPPPPRATTTSSSMDHDQQQQQQQERPMSASSVLAARLKSLVKGSNRSPPRTQGDASASAGPSASAPSQSQGSERNSEGSSQSGSGSEDEHMASASGSSSDETGIRAWILPAPGTSASASSTLPAGPAKCPSPGADSGEFSMSNGSGDDEEPGTSGASTSASKKAKAKDSGVSGATQPEEKKARDLEEEVRTLREARQCKICMDNEADVVFLPCGHLISCVRCATALSTCALCRQPIKAVVRTYMS